MTIRCVAAASVAFSCLALGTPALAGTTPVPPAPVTTPAPATAPAPTTALATALATAPVPAATAATPTPSATGPASLSLPALPARAPAPLDARAAATPHDAAALGGYDVLIADRGNRRLILVNPQKQILWEYHFGGVAQGADDSFFADGGRTIITNLEHGQIIEKIDIASGKPVWRYGKLGHKGLAPGFLDYPDDAYQLPNGNVMVADIRNCRLLEIAPDKKIVRQAGRTGDCSGAPGTLAAPNGDRPLANGDVLVSEIRGHKLLELNADWKPMLQFTLPILYPSDPQPTLGGNIIVAGYTKPGQIVEVDHQGHLLWRYTPGKGGALDRPSLAEELPDGNIIATDDLNQRVVVIDKKTSKILWQYGVRGVAGSKPGYLHIPDGIDIIPEAKS